MDTSSIDVIEAESALIYGKRLLVEFPHLERVIGIALEPPSQGRCGSEDLLYFETDQLE